VIPQAAGGLAVSAAVCAAAAAAGVLLIVVGLRPAPVASRRDWRMSLRLPRLLRRRRLLSAVAAAVAGAAVTGWPVLGAAAGLAVVTTPRLRSAAATRRQLDRMEALEAWTRRLADLLGSGAGGLEQAIDMSVRTCPAPIAAEVQALAARARVLGPEPALRAFADDLAERAGGLGSAAADLVAAALILRVRRGGRGLRPVLEGLAADVAELVRARRQVEADRAKPRSNVRVLLAVWAVVLTGTVLFARDYLSPFATPAGQVMLAAVLGVFTAGIWLLDRITRLPDTPRFLPDPAAGRTTPPPTSELSRSGSWG
jgi:tight adherence protein B